MRPTIRTSHPRRPHYESRPYRQHPGRREHIHGRVLPMDNPFPRQTLPWSVKALGWITAAVLIWEYIL